MTTNSDMKYWIISDTHFDHKEMVEYCGRPKDFDVQIKKNLITLNLEHGGDVLIHLGDVCIGNDKENNEFIGHLKGLRKILVRGNHDAKTPHWYMQHGWDLCVDRFDMTYGGKRIAFTHIPVGWDGYFDMNIHGHLHAANHRRNEEEIKKTLNSYHRLVALELSGYKSILLDKFL